MFFNKVLRSICFEAVGVFFGSRSASDMRLRYLAFYKLFYKIFDYSLSSILLNFIYIFLYVQKKLLVVFIYINQYFKYGSY